MIGNRFLITVAISLLVMNDADDHGWGYAAVGLLAAIGAAFFAMLGGFVAARMATPEDET